MAIKKYLFNLIIFMICVPLYYTRKIIIIQNAEPDENDPNILSITGQARAVCLLNIFGNGTDLTPQIIYSQNPNGDIYTPLPTSTVTYLANSLNVVLNNSFKDRQKSKLAASIESLDEDIYNTVLVCWSRYKIELMVQTLGIDNPPQWSDSYDNMWILEDKKLTNTLQGIKECIQYTQGEMFLNDASTTKSKLTLKNPLTFLYTLIPLLLTHFHFIYTAGIFYTIHHLLTEWLPQTLLHIYYQFIHKYSSKTSTSSLIRSTLSSPIIISSTNLNKISSSKSKNIVIPSSTSTSTSTSTTSSLSPSLKSNFFHYLKRKNLNEIKLKKQNK